MPACRGNDRCALRHQGGYGQGVSRQGGVICRAAGRRQADSTHGRIRPPGLRDPSHGESCPLPPRPAVRRSLELTGLAPLFRVVVTPDDVKHGKPAPDLFLLAAKLMKVPPGECLVFEDAEPGFKAAHAAGMKVVRVPRSEEHTSEL